MRKILAVACLTGLLAAPGIASAQAKSPHSFTGNMTLGSEYLFRGIAQTRGKPTLQGGLDYSHANGIYVGTWASNISWLSDAVAGASSSLEVDLYGGYKGTISGDLGFDVGILTYIYPGTGLPTGAADPDTTELYAGLSYKWFSIKYSHTTTSLFGWTKTSDPTAKTKGSGYLDLSGSWDLGRGFGLGAHIGHQSVKGRSSASYSDWRIGVTKEAPYGTFGLTLSDTNAKANCSTGQDYCAVNTTGNTYDAGKSRLVLTFGKTF